MKAGDTFLLRDRRVGSHLWIVISDPELDAERVIMVSMTSYEMYKEDVCLINVGDHPWFDHKTCIAYDEARMTTLERLQVLTDANSLCKLPPVSSEILRRIRKGVSKSTRIEFKYIDILIEQGDVD